jgi:hypothetical protein
MKKIEKQRDDLEEERVKLITRKINEQNDEAMKTQWKDAEELRQKSIEQLREQIRSEFQTLYEAKKQRDIKEALEKATVCSSFLIYWNIWSSRLGYVLCLARVQD